MVLKRIYKDKLPERLIILLIWLGLYKWVCSYYLGKTSNPFKTRVWLGLVTSTGTPIRCMCGVRRYKIRFFVGGETWYCRECLRVVGRWRMGTEWDRHIIGGRNKD